MNKQFKYTCTHITDYTTQPLPVVRRVPHPWLLEIPMENTHPIDVISRFETVHAHSITPPKEQEQVEWEEYLIRALVLTLLFLLVAYSLYIGWLLLGIGFPA